MILAEPYEFVDLSHGRTMVLRVTSLEDGSAVIHPRTPSPRHVAQHMAQKGLDAAPAAGTPISIETEVLRLHGQRLDEPSPAPYWDVSSKTLRADLLARSKAGLQTPFILTLTANGAAPYKRYSVMVAPA